MLDVIREGAEFAGPGVWQCGGVTVMLPLHTTALCIDSLDVRSAHAPGVSVRHTSYAEATMYVQQHHWLLMDTLEKSTCNEAFNSGQQ